MATLSERAFAALKSPPGRVALGDGEELVDTIELADRIMSAARN
jgi:hypothetical protein